jgi:hypothetical protein
VLTAIGSYGVYRLLAQTTRSTFTRVGLTVAVWIPGIGAIAYVLALIYCFRKSGD